MSRASRNRASAFIDKRPGLLVTPKNSSSGSCIPDSEQGADNYKQISSLRSHYIEYRDLTKKVKSTPKHSNVAWAETQGRRATMEDQIVISGHKNFDLFGVFDGHNGSDAAHLAGDRIFFQFSKLLDSGLSPCDALLQSFTCTNECLRRNKITGGTTALVTVVMGNGWRSGGLESTGGSESVLCSCPGPGPGDTGGDSILEGPGTRSVIVANAGDCRAVVWRGASGRVERITKDHKPGDIFEKKRIESLGGQVIGASLPNGSVTHRVNGILAVSRAMGDFTLEPYITAVPDVFEIEFSNEDYMIMACDGLWDVLKDDEVINICNAYWKDNKGDLEGAVKRLRNTAYSRDSGDNVSILIWTKTKNNSVTIEL